MSVSPDRPTENLRIGDLERSQAADDLARHYAEGRLDADELRERLAKTFAAKTRSDLFEVLGDLPAGDAARLLKPPPYAPPLPVAPKYCVACGNGLVATAAICPRCGTAQAQPKSRGTAVVMAVFLSFWAFLYTYSRSRWKFWLGLGLDSSAMAVNVTTHAPFTGPVWFLVSLGVWIWAIVDRSVTPL